jgi:hypothetical protein
MLYVHFVVGLLAMLISETLDIRGRIETWELIVILRNILRRLLDCQPEFVKYKLSNFFLVQVIEKMLSCFLGREASLLIK